MKKTGGSGDYTARRRARGLHVSADKMYVLPREPIDVRGTECRCRLSNDLPFPTRRVIRDNASKIVQPRPAMSLPVKVLALTLLLILQFAETSLAADTEGPKVKELIDAEEAQEQAEAEAAVPKAIPADQYDRGS